MTAINEQSFTSGYAEKAGKAAASGQHALINLTRLVKSLEGRINSTDEDWDAPYAARKDWETVTYARTLLNTLQEGNEQSSKTTSTLSDLSRILNSVEKSYRIRLSSPTPTPYQNPALIALPMSPIPSSSSAFIPIPISTSVTKPNEISPTITSTASVSTTNVEIRRRIQSRTDEYLSLRSRENLSTENVTSLLPLKDQPPTNKTRGRVGNGKGHRDNLLGDISEKAGLGHAQLHEELGGQLADMSHRLKMNAVHFANSLEEEKSLLEESQDVLEKNLASTRSSKKQLSTVSTKGKGTTCLTLGVVIFVMVVFVWTYLLIRFT